jgi:hypothetical protein
VGKRQVESVTVVPTTQREVGSQSPYGAIGDRVDGWVVAGLVAPVGRAILAVVEVNVGTGVRGARVATLEGMPSSDLV